MNHYDPETAPATDGWCDEHDQPKVLIGRMTLDGPLEYACPKCTNPYSEEWEYTLDDVDYYDGGQDEAEADAYAAYYD